MAYVPVTDNQELLQLVAAQVNNCPLAIIKEKIALTAADFFQTSGVWLYHGVQPLDAVAAQPAYVFGTGATVGALPDAGVEVITIKQLLWGDTPLEPISPAELKAKGATWFKDAGDPEVFACFEFNEFWLWRVPEASAADQIQVPEVTLAPKQSAGTVDENVLARYREDISYGVLAKLFSMAGKPYSNPEAARDNELAYNRAIGVQSIAAATSRGHTRLRTQTIYR